jgi:GT2 family glycosyltransferase
VIPAVSIVIVNLNRCDLLEACLRSVWAQTFADVEVIVVDNGSTDSSVEFLRSVAGPRLRVVALSENRGFAGGCNAGIAVARGRYIATLNNDAEADPRWLEELVPAMESDARAGMCASKILFHGERTRIDKAGHLIYLDGLRTGSWAIRHAVRCVVSGWCRSALPSFDAG